MEVIIQDEIASPYVTAPSSPSGGSLNTLWFHSAPTSPVKNIGSLHDYIAASKANEDSNCSLGDDFEFETSRKFGSDMNFEGSKNFECPTDDEHHQHKPKPQECGESLPTMTFADELFSNGQVLPLKLPPRLQHGNCMNFASQRSSIPTSPRSPNPILKSPFSWNLGNDDFDPFMVALEKVREEKRGRIYANQPGRTRSLSPFRTTTTTTTPLWSNDSERWEQCKQNDGGSPLQVEFKPVKLLEPKGSAYARWLRHHSIDHRCSPHGRTSPRGLTKLKSLYFSRRSRSEKMGQQGAIKPTSTIGREPTIVTEMNGEYTQSRMERIKNLLLRYTSFGRDRSETMPTGHNVAIRKPSSFMRISFKFKENSIGNGRKRVPMEPKMTIVPHKPTLGLCLGYGLESPGSSF